MQFVLNAKNTEFSDLSTLIFVDYESWFFGAKNEYKAETDIFDWFEDVQKKGHIEDILFFGDFNTDVMKNEVQKIRSISSNIIDCRKSANEKEFTDFIILDHLYQKLIRQPSIKQFILFSGDGHFQSVIAFLRNFQSKIFGVYAIHGTMSTQLANAANWYVEVIPEQNKTAVEAIIKNLEWAKTQSGLVPTFKKTIDVILRHRPDINEDQLTQTLRSLIDEGYILQVDTILQNGNQVRALVPEWQKIQNIV